MSRTFSQLTANERDEFIRNLTNLVPAHTWWSGNTATWTTAKAIWSIEVDFTNHRYTLRQGTENKWVRFENDIEWLKSVLTLLEAVQ